MTDGQRASLKYLAIVAAALALGLPAPAQSQIDVQWVHETLTNQDTRKGLCRVFRLASARSFVVDGPYQRMGATREQVQAWRDDVRSLAREMCRLPFRERETIQKLLALGTTTISINRAIRGNLSAKDARGLMYAAAASTGDYYRSVCRRPTADVILQASDADFEAHLSRERSCDRFARSGAPISIPEPEREGQLDPVTGLPKTHQEQKQCFTQMVSSMHPPEVCNAFAETEAQVKARLAKAEIEAAKQKVDEAKGKLDQAAEDLKKAQDNAAADPTDQNKAAADDAQKKYDQAKAEYDNAEKELADSKAEGERADAAVRDEAKAKEVTLGENAITVGIAIAGAVLGTGCAIATGGGCALAFGFGLGLTGGGFGLVIHGLMDCLAPAMTAPGLLTPYLVSDAAQSQAGPSEAPRKRPPTPDMTSLSKRPPNWMDVYDYCTCVARLGSVSDAACPSDSKKKRMDCVRNPYTGNDAPRPECMTLLQEDNAEIKPRLGACSLMSCRIDALAAKSPEGQCACVPKEEVGSKLLPSSACKSIDCGDGNNCMCTAGIGCSCKAKRAEIPAPWIAQKPPGVGPGGGPKPKPVGPDLLRLSPQPSGPN